MEKGSKVILMQPTGEAKECKISKTKPAFCYFSVKEEYRFNTVLECLEKKINGKWVECCEWNMLTFPENTAVNPLWTFPRKELAKEILFLMDERKVSVLERIARNLMETDELRLCRQYTENFSES